MEKRIASERVNKTLQMCSRQRGFIHHQRPHQTKLAPWLSWKDTAMSEPTLVSAQVMMVSVRGDR